MPSVTFVLCSGEEILVNVSQGTSVRDAAVGHFVDGIDGDCGGNCSCATCHVHVDADWYTRVGTPHELESDLLSLLDNTADHSRLSCQIRLTDELDGLKVYVPMS